MDAASQGRLPDIRFGDGPRSPWGDAVRTFRRTARCPAHDIRVSAMWPDRRLLDLLGIDLPIIQAPMAGATDAAMAIAVSAAGGLGSLPCALLTPARAHVEIGVIRQRTSRPLNVNFFCHSTPHPDVGREAAWKSRFERYYAELGLDASASAPAPNRGAIRRRDVRCRGRVQAGSRELSFRASRTTAARPGTSARLQGAQLGDHC